MAEVRKRAVNNVSIIRLWNNFTISLRHEFLNLGKHQARRKSIKREDIAQKFKFRMHGMESGANTKAAV
jgi:hypothetical protein